MNGNGNRAYKLAWAGALAIHFLLFVVVFPEAGNSLDIPPDRPTIVIKKYTPPKPPPDKPKTKPIRHIVNPVPIPDPTPDEPEPIVIDEEVVYDQPLEKGPETDFVVAAPTGPPPTKTPPVEPVRAGAEVEMPSLLHRVAPVYPELARRAHMECTVILEATIAPDGTVADATVLRGCAMGFDQAALEAVSQWVYSPTLYRGRPVPVILTATVIFQLQ
jgi:protein TonB